MPTQSKKRQFANSSKTSDEPAARFVTGAPSAWAVGAVLTILIGIVYGRSSNVPFVFDDRDSIITNKSIVSLWPLMGTSEHPGPLNPPPDIPTSARPLANLSLAVNYWVGGLKPGGYHVGNMLLHLASALLVAAIVRRTLQLPYFNARFKATAGWLALAVAILWASHPLQTEAVIYATQRTELMVAFFYLATLYCSLRYWLELPRSPVTGSPWQEEVGGEGDSLPASTSFDTSDPRRQRRAMWLVLAFIACLCGMASKEVMVSAPLIVLLFERAFVAGSLKTSLRRSWPLYVGLASTWLLLLVLNLGAPRGESAGFGLGVSGVEWWLTQTKVLLIYLKLAFLPWPLLFHYELPYLKAFAEAWVYVVPVFLFGSITLVLLWRNHPIGFLATWVFAILSPTLVVPIVGEMAAERRMYLPFAAIIALLVIGGYRIVEIAWNYRTQKEPRFASHRLANIVTAGVTLLLMVVFALASAKRLEDYDDEMILWRQVAQTQPNNWMAHDNLGGLLMKAGRLPEAIDEYRAAMAIKPDSHSLPNSIGVALMHMGRYPEAIENFERALRINPDYAEAYENLGNALSKLERYPEAIAQIERSLQLKPNSVTAHETLAVALAGNGQITEAIVHLRRAIEIDPSYANARINLATILGTTTDTTEAIEQLEYAIKLLPDRADIHNSLGVLFGKTGRTSEAIEHFHTALRLNPNYAQAYSNLALALAFANRSEEAIAMSERAIQVARSSGQAQEAAMAEEWLQHYRAELRHPGPQSK